MTDADAELPAEVRAVGADSLARVVRAALGRGEVAVEGWRVERIGGGARRAGGGVFRFAGEGTDGAERVPWSVVLKVATRGDHARRAQGDPADPRNMHYPPRERLAFDSGLLAELPGLGAPRCFGAEERADGATWLWLEDVPESGPARWPIGRYATAARHLGELNGAFLATRPFPDHPWLSGGYVPYLRGWRAAIQPWEQALTEPAIWEQPAARQLFPSPLHERVVAALAERPRCVEALAALPETLCHNDAFRRNLIGTGGRDGHERTIALDWEYVGRGPVGLEPGLLVTTSLLFGDADAAECRALDAAVFESYLDGLRATGWRGDPRDARLGYAASGAARWSVGPLSTAIQAVTSEDPATRAGLEGWLNMPIERAAEQLAGLGRYLLDLADEAVTLIGRA